MPHKVLDNYANATLGTAKRVIYLEIRERAQLCDVCTNMHVMFVDLFV